MQIKFVDATALSTWRRGRARTHAERGARCWGEEEAEEEEKSDENARGKPGLQLLVREK